MYRSDLPSPSSTIMARRRFLCVAFVVMSASASTPPSERISLSCIAAAFPPPTQCPCGSTRSLEAKWALKLVMANDMFDKGNVMRLRTHGQWTEPLKYTQVCGGESSEPAGAFAYYSTCKTSKQHQPSWRLSTQDLWQSMDSAQAATSALTAAAPSLPILATAARLRQSYQRRRLRLVQEDLEQ